MKQGIATARPSFSSSGDPGTVGGMSEQVPRPTSPGELATARYLDDVGHPWVHESEVEGRNPDFLVDTPAGRIVMEVYEPTVDWPAIGQDPLPVPPVGYTEIVRGPTAEAIRTAFTGRKYKQASRPAGQTRVRACPWRREHAHWDQSVSVDRAVSDVWAIEGRRIP